VSTGMPGACKAPEDLGIVVSEMAAISIVTKYY